MTPQPQNTDHEFLANLFATMERLKEAERQDRKIKEDAKLEKIQKRGGLWWGDSEPRNQLNC